MPASFDHPVLNVLAPVALSILDFVVPAIRQLVIILHGSFLVAHIEAEPVIDVSAAIRPVRKIVLILNDAAPQIHLDRDQEALVSGEDIGTLLSGVSRSIRTLALAAYDTISALAD